VESTQYEAGVQHQLSDHVSIGCVGFYKDMENLITVLDQIAYPHDYTTLSSDGFATAKGVEFEFDLRRTNGIAAHLTYSIQQVEGRGEWAYKTPNHAWQDPGPLPPEVRRLAYEQPHEFTASVDLRADAGAGPRLGSAYPLERTGVDVVVMAASGFPYTPIDLGDGIMVGTGNPVAFDQTYSARAPSTLRMDLKANKMIPLGGTTLDLYLWVLNVLDRDNAVEVYTSSGLPGETGWLETPSGREWLEENLGVTDVSGLTGVEKYHLREDDPNNFDTPRQIRFGARLLF